MRDLVAKMKLLPNEAFTREPGSFFLDDSIVRGTQLKDNVVKLRECGVKRGTYPDRLSSFDLPLLFS